MTQFEKTASYSHLPNAPLVEVIFELRWKLKEDSSQNPPFNKSDPGYSILADNFITTAYKHGFKVSQKIPLGGNLPLLPSVDYRLYKNKEQPFPLWQIGPGIFASNESAKYIWKPFKNLTINGIKVLLESYPKMKSFSMELESLELRYIDSFGSALISHQDLLKFLNENTSLNIKLPPLLMKEPIGKHLIANLFFEFPYKKMKNTYFTMQIGKGIAHNQQSIILESKVFSKLDQVRIGKTKNKQLNYIKEWLEKAHEMTSPFFKQFVHESLMDIFRSKSSASSKGTS